MFGKICGMERRISITLGRVVLLLLTGMSIVGVISVWLFARTMLYLLGETAFPTVVAESFWICIWLVFVEAAIIVVAVILCLAFGPLVRKAKRKAKDAAMKYSNRW